MATDFIITLKNIANDYRFDRNVINKFRKIVEVWDRFNKKGSALQIRLLKVNSSRLSVDD